jgi:hypothetical protein
MSIGAELTSTAANSAVSWTVLECDLGGQRLKRMEIAWNRTTFADRIKEHDSVTVVILPFVHLFVVSLFIAKRTK